MRLVSERESYLNSVLSAGVDTLPPPIEDGRIWVWGIALVIKVTGRREYVIVRNDTKVDSIDNRSYAVVKDFGNPSMIARIIDIYPFEYVKYIPEVKGKKAISEWVLANSNSKKEEVDSYSSHELKNVFFKTLVENHIKVKKKKEW